MSYDIFNSAFVFGSNLGIVCNIVTFSATCRACHVKCVWRALLIINPFDVVLLAGVHGIAAGRASVKIGKFVTNSYVQQPTTYHLFTAAPWQTLE